MAIREAQVESPEEILHIGDHLEKDYKAAVRVGMRSILLDRFSTEEAMQWRNDGLPVSRSLKEVQEWLNVSGLIAEQPKAARKKN